MRRFRCPLLAVACALLVSACGGAAGGAGQPSAPAASTVAASPSAPASVAASAAASGPAATSPSASPSGATSPSGSRVAEPIRFGMLPSLASSPVFVGVDSGAYAAEGVDVKLTTFTDTVKILVSIAGGQLDMGQITLGAAAFNAFHRGVDVKLIASSNQDPAGPGAIAPLVVRTDLYNSGAVTSAAQLKGRKLATNGKGTVLEYSTAKVLAAGGLKLKDVNLVYMPLPDMLVALGNKAIDAALILEPLATLAVQKGLGKIVSDNYSPNTQYGIIAVNTAFARAHPKAVTRFLIGYIKTIRRLSNGRIKHDAQALTIVQKYVKTPPAVVKKAPDPYWPLNAKLNLKSVQSEQNYFIQAKSVDYGTAIPLNKMIDQSYLDAALKQTGG
ncbi:MAG: ABC transporter substrate-binding protein [Chloroflexota bacterium]